MDQLKILLSTEEYDKLVIGNVSSLDEIITSSIQELQRKTNLRYKSLESIIELVARLLTPKFQTADNVPPWPVLTTGCKSIDLLTNGGIPMNGITEIVGYSGVGKTQLCLQLCLTCQLYPPANARGTGVVYICTENPFPSKRFNQLANIFNEKEKLNIDFEKNVYLQHIGNYELMQKALFKLLPNFLLFHKVGLIIIDSIAGLFRSENLDTIYSRRSLDFAKLVAQLNKLATDHSLGVICVNQVSENVDTNETVPSLGLAWSNLVTNRFNINRFRDSQVREFEIVFSPELPNKSCNFYIGCDGLY